MDDDVESNAAAVVAHLEHLIAAYQQAHPTPVLRADIAHSQSGDQSSGSEETESESFASEEDQLDPLYVRDEDHTDDDEE